MSDEGNKKALQKIGEFARNGTGTLILAGLRLTELPPELFELQGLRSLFLLNNSLAKLPISFERLVDLQILDISGNKLERIPDALGGLTSLEALYLSNNQLTEIPGSIGDLGKLQYLYAYGNQLTTLPDSLRNLTALQELNLHGNLMTTIPNSIFDLGKLSKLSLYKNHLTSMPESLGNLKELRELHLYNNEIKGLADSVGDLTNLQVLDLHDNLITEIPEAWGKLESLREFSLRSNRLTILPESLGRLKNLHTLDLRGNRLLAIPESIGNLSNLQELSLSGHQITSIPESIGGLRSLRKLELSDNRITTVPVSLGDLDKLQELNLSRNQITAVPDSVGSLANLVTLDLHENLITGLPNSIGNLVSLKEMLLQVNQISELPSSIANLKRLLTLDISDNRLTALPLSIGRLKSLVSLSLQNNQITELPPPLYYLANLRKLFLKGNPRLGVPMEVVDVESNAMNEEVSRGILEYYFRARNTGRLLNEAKLILVGRGAVGKTSLVKRLIFDTFDPQESKTDGINIHKWGIVVDGEQIRLNVWDFGGQEIMHATHQFFLTERSLYVLVLSGRDGGEDLDAEYWLKLIESFGAHSPVLIVLNKIKEHAFDLNRNALLRKYPNIRSIVRTDCRDDIGISELRRIIVTETPTLDELYVRFPGEWFSIKDRLASIEQNFLNFQQYRDLCSANGVKDKKHQEMLARYLNQLGIVLNYKDDFRLKDTHVLNPHWVTDGIYQILNSSILEKNAGEIMLRDVSAILPESEYPAHMCRFILDLMKKFDLCFSFPDDDCHYLIPELLPKNEPDKVSEFNLDECLNFQFHYPILPEGLLPRFITRTHHLSESEPRWRSGVILKFEDCEALVKADAVERKVYISIGGENAEGRRRLLAVIRADLDRIHREIKNLNPLEIVPLPGLPNEGVRYKDLLVMESKQVVDFPKVVGTEVKNFKIADLLKGVDFPTKVDENPLTLFYSYAHEDESYKLQLETHLKILQRQGLIKDWSDREIEAGKEWSAEILDHLENADIILLLISSDFLASDFCYDVEMKAAMQRRGRRRVIPIIIRDCLWEAGEFADLQGLPKEGGAIDKWENRDSAWRSVAEGIKKVAEALIQRR